MAFVGSATPCYHHGTHIFREGSHSLVTSLPKLYTTIFLKMELEGWAILVWVEVGAWQCGGKKGKIKLSNSHLQFETKSLKNVQGLSNQRFNRFTFSFINNNFLDSSGALTESSLHPQDPRWAHSPQQDAFQQRPKILRLLIHEGNGFLGKREKPSGFLERGGKIGPKNPYHMTNFPGTLTWFYHAGRDSAPGANHFLGRLGSLNTTWHHMYRIIWRRKTMLCVSQPRPTFTGVFLIETKRGTRGEQYWGKRSHGLRLWRPSE